MNDRVESLAASLRNKSPGQSETPYRIMTAVRTQQNATSSIDGRFVAGTSGDSGTPIHPSIHPSNGVEPHITRSNDGGLAQSPRADGLDESQKPLPYERPGADMICIDILVWFDNTIDTSYSTSVFCAICGKGGK